jgi:hypothetical protein
MYYNNIRNLENNKVEEAAFISEDLKNRPYTQPYNPLLWPYEPIGVPGVPSGPVGPPDPQDFPPGYFEPGGPGGPPHADPNFVPTPLPPHPHEGLRRIPRKLDRPRPTKPKPGPVPPPDAGPEAYPWPWGNPFSPYKDAPIS